MVLHGQTHRARKDQTAGAASLRSLIRPAGRGRLRRFVSLLLLTLCVSFGKSSAADRVTASLENDEAWTGEGVPLIVTLYSLGPFSGTASMDLPEIPATVFIRQGSPVVGSETIDGETWLTQRHELKIYTLRAGTVVIPPFRIRFESKKDFVSQAEPVVAKTSELRFQSNIPPGTQEFGSVVTASHFTASQSWSPDGDDSQTGDVIQRTITQTAQETTAMLLPSVAASAPHGIRIYPTTPVVEDKSNRGLQSASRIDTVKYQFERAGTFEIPDVELVWFDAESEELKRNLLRGRTFTVDGIAASTETATDSEKQPNEKLPWAAILVTLAVFGLALKTAFTAWSVSYNAPEAVAARRVSVACKANDASAAYAAVLNWRRIEGLCEIDGELLRECDELASRLFGQQTDAATWDGHRLHTAFARSRKQRKNAVGMSTTLSELPALNPGNPNNAVSFPTE